MTASPDPVSQKQPAWKPKCDDPQGQRLWAALQDAERRLSQLQHRPERSDEVVNACRNCIDRAWAAAAHHRYVAWDCLHQFEAEFLRGLTCEEREARWCVLQAEAGAKLKDWRNEAAAGLNRLAAEHRQRSDETKKAVDTALESTKRPNEDHCRVPLHLLSELLAQLATVSQNQQHKLELYQKQSFPEVRRALKLALIIAIVVVAALLSAGRWLEGFAYFLPWGQALGLGIVAGALGGVVSTAFSIGRADLKARIPDLRLSRDVTRVRPWLGATVAIPITVLVKAEFVKVAGFDGLLAIWAFCFIGGFSERWFLGVLERFEASKK